MSQYVWNFKLIAICNHSTMSMELFLSWCYDLQILLPSLHAYPHTKFAKEKNIAQNSMQKGLQFTKVMILLVKYYVYSNFLPILCFCQLSIPNPFKWANWVFNIMPALGTVRSYDGSYLFVTPSKFAFGCSWSITTLDFPLYAFHNHPFLITSKYVLQDLWYA